MPVPGTPHAGMDAIVLGGFGEGPFAPEQFQDTVGFEPRGEKYGGWPWGHRLEPGWMEVSLRSTVSMARHPPNLQTYTAPPALETRMGLVESEVPGGFEPPYKVLQTFA